jgi:lysozyme
MNTFDMPTLLAELKRDEGVRLKPYTDTVGKLTIGVGRNLTDVGISDDECTALLQNDIAKVLAQLDRSLPWWRKLDPVRQRVLVNMAFNMGMTGLLTFKNTLAAVQSGSYAAAAAGMLASKWATQVGARAERLADMMRTGAA